MKIKLILFIIVIIVGGGCATIPKDASVLSESVNRGIDSMQTQCEVIIKAMGDIERAILDEKYDEICDSAEAKYRRSNNIPGDQMLSSENWKDLTVIIISVRENILAEIEDKENNLIELTRLNAMQVQSINGEVQRYILSLEKYDEATTQISALTKRVVGIDPKKLLGTVEHKLLSINQLINEQF